MLSILKVKWVLNITLKKNKSVNPGDGVMWMSNGGEQYGDVISVKTNYIKVRDNVTEKIFSSERHEGNQSISKSTFRRRIPTLNPGSPPLDGGSRRKRTLP